MGPLSILVSLFVILLASSTLIGADVLKEGKICFPGTKKVCLTINSRNGLGETAKLAKAPTWRVETISTSQDCIRIIEAASGMCLHEQATRFSISPCILSGETCERGQGWTIIGDLNGKFQLKGNRELENKCLRAATDFSVEDTDRTVVLDTECGESLSEQEMTIV